jgi:hypothetical protein
MILPEAFLFDTDRESRINSIHRAMSGCLEQNVFAPLAHAGVFVERSCPSTRQGLVVAVDLDQYDWRPGTHSPIRLTEDTVTS